LKPEILETRKARESGQKEIERLIQKLQLDKEILADADEEATN